MVSRKRIVVVIALGLFAGILLLCAMVLRPMFGYTAPVNSVRWLLRSRSYKAEVSAQPDSASGELKHIVWDGWGWGGEDTTVYLVFDPTDSLAMPSVERRRGKFNGIPCEVPSITRMERNWYAVQFYTNELWGRRNALDCRGGD